jgi:hypothetical protein
MLTRVSTAAILLSASLTVGEAGAQAPAVDWKMYGGTSSGGDAYCFYDLNTLSKAPDGLVRIWTKCLLVSDLNGIDIQTQFGGTIFRTASSKLASHYVAPLVKLQTNLDNLIDVVIFELIADMADLAPASTVNYELNCQQLMIRELSALVNVNGQTSSTTVPAGWKYIPPQGSAAILVRLLCPA